MRVVAEDVLEFGAGGGRLVLGGVEFGELDLGAGIGMVLRDVLPIEQGVVGFAEGGDGFGNGHHGVAVIVIGFHGDDAFEQGPGLVGPFQAEQALAKMGAGVEVGGVTFERGAVGFLGVGKFAALEINVAELEMMVRVVEVMDFRLELADAGAALRAGQLEAGGRGLAIDGKVIPEGADAEPDENEQGPEPFPVAEGMHQHPDLKDRDRQPDRIRQERGQIHDLIEQRGEHSPAQARVNDFGWQSPFSPAANCRLVFGAFHVYLMTRSRMNQTLIIVPTYNERENLPRMVAKLLSLPVGVDVLVVDDNSPDGTGQRADELAAQHPQIYVLHRSGKNGLGRAYIAGFQWALEKHYEFIFEMDCDFSHDPEAIPNFLKAAEKADLILGSRYDGGVRVLNWPLKRLLLSRFAGIYVWIVTGMPFTDPTGGYKCFRRHALQAVALDAVKSNGYSFQIEMTHRLWRKGYQVAEVPITFTERVEGSSKLSRHIVIEAFWMVWWLWLQHGCRRWPGKKA